MSQEPVTPGRGRISRKYNGAHADHAGTAGGSRSLVDYWIAPIEDGTVEKARIAAKRPDGDMTWRREWSDGKSGVMEGEGDG